MNLLTPLPLDQASTIIETAITKGREANLKPLTVVVLDLGGQMIAMKREDGSGIIRQEIALGKAYGALGLGINSRIIFEKMTERPTFLAAIAAASGGRVVPVPSGVLIKNADGKVIGAVGISGDTSDKDEYAAIEGVKAAGLTADPAAPNPDWADTSL